MEFFYPSNFFDLSAFRHASLFNREQPAWTALKKIDDYLHSLSLGVIEGIIENGAYLISPENISIGKGSVVEAGAYIKGPCVIGENCQIRHGAYIRGGMIAGNKCVIGHATEVKNSILMDGAQAGHFAYVGDSVLGNHVNLGAGTKCANLRFDNHHVHVIWKETRLDTGLRKFGAIFGDRSQTGCNSVTNPGTILGIESCLSPCTTARGIVPHKFIIKTAETSMAAVQHD
jgi:UDP-N-acetylglucosamine diphosphorylase / glucose-1-phosphate thymidylyltransferase / UDP-N-acetylgalactosamine diphosphorylase / glucosamine-1-phosphate N-acetyltransferase / galactosamine-1-phosphate N-acetyltransferase